MEKFDAFLKTRFFEPESGMLTSRIIMMAYHTRQQSAMTLSNWLVRLFAEFMLPKPAYAFASLLVAGLLGGFALAQYDGTGAKSINLASNHGFLYNSELDNAAEYE